MIVTGGRVASYAARLVLAVRCRGPGHRNAGRSVRGYLRAHRRQGHPQPPGRASRTSLMGLADDVGNAISAQPGVFGFYARNLGTDDVVEVDADRVLHAESAIKTCILVHYSRLVAAGAVDPTTRVPLTD